MKAIASKRLLLVAGSNSAGRASVAAAAALALGRRKATLLVDADEPAHGMGDALGATLVTGEPSPLTIDGEKPPGINGQPLMAARLSAPDARSQMEDLMATEAWNSILKKDAGLNFAQSLGIPINELVEVINCFHPPPGAEMPVALATLLRNNVCQRSRHVVVDAGAAVLANQLQNVPPAVSKGLDGMLRVHKLLRKAKEAGIPSAFVAGMRVMVGPLGKEDWTAQITKTVFGLECLREAMAALAKEEQAVLLVLPYRPGRAGQRAACRTIERLQPTSIALTGHSSADAHLAERPEWLPPGPAVLTLPWGDERPSGIHELARLADAMSTG